MKSKKLEIPIYPGDLTIIFGKNSKKIARKFKIKLDNDYYNFKKHDAIVAENEGNYMSIIIMFSERILKKSSPKMAKIIAHEAKHVVNKIFSTVGIRLDYYNDEAECYLLGWVVEQIYKIIGNENSGN